MGMLRLKPNVMELTKTFLGQTNIKTITNLPDIPILHPFNIFIFRHCDIAMLSI